MRYIIYLRDKSEIEITEKDYNNISKFLGQLKLFRLEKGEIVNAADISRISPSAQPVLIPKEKRLPEQTITGEEKRIKVPGGFQKPSVREGMIRLFDQLKSQGQFREFEDYFEWERKKYNDDNDDIEGMKAVKAIQE